MHTNIFYIVSINYFVPFDNYVAFPTFDRIKQKSCKIHLILSIVYFESTDKTSSHLYERQTFLLYESRNIILIVTNVNIIHFHESGVTWNQGWLF